MASQIADVMSRVRSEMKRSGIFSVVQGTEPESTPGKGLTTAIFHRHSQPVELVLNGASSLYVYTMRIYTDQLGSPEQEIEDRIVEAIDQVINFLSEDFTLGGNIREIDFLGQFGHPVRAESGYIEVVGNPNSRIVDIDIPLVVNDTIIFE